MNPTTRMTRYTLQYLLLACYNKQGEKIKPSYKDELLACTSSDEIKKIVWDKCKSHVRNLESFKKGQRYVDYNALFTWAQEEKNDLTI